ncbi:MAG: hypothetical protein A2W85_13450 [Bacteroidetes bacterium GWF2_41_31]|jgi:hypothetical protein|nr:MAG: hypothetical protein A2W85_13450 [Bacteroidetes bacterium GWF2_41_31]OFZ02318.1 MAG: hypothetical protein A2338_02715 [Bacteroidetes bacterium RIFOXYB12_FULL_41_6]
MKLISSEIQKRFREIGRQDVPNPIVVAKFFNPCGPGTWYATEYDETNQICFGYVTGLGYDEWGDFSIKELEALKCPPLGLPIERDLYTSERTITQHCPELKEEIERRQELRAIEFQQKQTRDQELDR